MVSNFFGCPLVAGYPLAPPMPLASIYGKDDAPCMCLPLTAIVPDSDLCLQTVSSMGPQRGLLIVQPLSESYGEYQGVLLCAFGGCAQLAQSPGVMAANTSKDPWGSRASAPCEGRGAGWQTGRGGPLCAGAVAMLPMSQMVKLEPMVREVKGSNPLAGVAIFYRNDSAPSSATDKSNTQAEHTDLMDHRGSQLRGGGVTGTLEQRCAGEVMPPSCSTYRGQRRLQCCSTTGRVTRTVARKGGCRVPVIKN